MPFFPKNKKNIDRVAIVNMTRAKWACVHCWYNPKYFMLTQCLEMKARGCCMHVFLVVFSDNTLVKCFADCEIFQWSMTHPKAIRNHVYKMAYRN